MDENIQLNKATVKVSHLVKLFSLMKNKRRFLTNLSNISRA